MQGHEPENGKPEDLGHADATRHLRDHLECAQMLARNQDLQVVHYLIEMAILALSSGPQRNRRDRE